MIPVELVLVPAYNAEKYLKEKRKNFILSSTAYTMVLISFAFGMEKIEFGILSNDRIYHLYKDISFDEMSFFVSLFFLN